MRDWIRAHLLGSAALLFATSAGAETSVPPTPLVLNDGRTAQVSIHHMPFIPGRSALSGDAAGELEGIGAAVATDCFLSAQIIGHVSSSEVDGADTLAMHRLASARADSVQADLIRGGLPTKGVASTWDWQFLIQEPRVTLWVFELTRGVDCSGNAVDLNVAEQEGGAEGEDPKVRSEIITVEDGLPTTGSSGGTDVAAAADAGQDPKAIVAEIERQLETTEGDADETAAAASEDGTAAATAAAAAAASSVTAATSNAATAASNAASEAAEQTADAAQAGLIGSGSTTEEVVEKSVKIVRGADEEDAGEAALTDQVAEALAKPDGSADTAAANAEAEATAAGDQFATTAEAATETTGATAGAAEAVTAQAADQAAETAQNSGETVVAAVDATNTTSGASASGGNGNPDLLVEFAANSSYYASGTNPKLKELLAGIEGSAVITLSAGISHEPVRNAKTQADSIAYNKWLSERRIDRVAEYLKANAGDRVLDIIRDFRDNDESRDVNVTVN